MSEFVNIYINEQAFEINPDHSLVEVLSEFGAQQPYGILLNGEFLPSSNHLSTQLKPEDRVEVISAIQGG